MGTYQSLEGLLQKRKDLTADRENLAPAIADTQKLLNAAVSIIYGSADGESGK